MTVESLVQSLRMLAGTESIKSDPVLHGVLIKAADEISNRLTVNQNEAPEGYIAVLAQFESDSCRKCDALQLCRISNDLKCYSTDRKDGCDVRFIRKPKDDVDARYLLTVRGSPVTEKRLRKIAKRLNGGRACTR